MFLENPVSSNMHLRMQPRFATVDKMAAISTECIWQWDRLIGLANGIIQKTQKPPKYDIIDKNTKSETAFFLSFNYKTFRLSSLAQSAAKLWLTKIRRIRANQTYCATSLFLSKFRFFSHNFGSGNATKLIKPCKDSNYSFVYKKSLIKK